MGLSALFLSEPQLVAPGSTIPPSSQLDLKNDRINTIIHTYYILPYVITFLGLVGWLLFDNTIITIAVKLAFLCKKDIRNDTKYKLSHDYY